MNRFGATPTPGMTNLIDLRNIDFLWEVNTEFIITFADKTMRMRLMGANKVTQERVYINLSFMEIGNRKEAD